MSASTITDKLVLFGVVHSRRRRTGETTSIGFAWVVRNANGVGSRFRATIRYLENLLPENDSRPLPRNATRIHLSVLRSSLVALLLIFLCCWRIVSGSENDAVPAGVQQFVANHCYDCHQGTAAEAGLDLASLSRDLDDEEAFARWVRAMDRVGDGEMPPPDSSMASSEEVEQFLQAAGQWLRGHQRQEFAEQGRVRGRRLTNLQVERTLHDLLGIDIPLAELQPEEPRPHLFATVADGQTMSRFQMEAHLAVVDAALDEAMRRVLGPEDNWQRTLDAKTLSRTRPQSRTREPELIDGRAVTWSSRLIFYGRLPATTARESGWYRFTIRASALKRPPEQGVWCTVRSGPCVSSAPLLSWVGAFEATKETKQWTFEAWLPRGHMLEIRPGDATLKMARFEGGQVGTGEGEPQNVPGVAIESIRMERFHRGPDNQQLRRLLFGDLPLVAARNGRPAEIVSERPKDDARHLIHSFAQRAFRRPVSEAELAPYVALVLAAIDAGEPLPTAVRDGYRALLCSPRFLYFHESPGDLDHWAIANRLSYFLWNSMPDEQLFQLAADGKLRDSQVLREQVERMLDLRGERTFVEDLAAEWLDLRLIDSTEPDRALHPSFDVIVQHAMLDETHAYLETMLREDLSVGHLIQSDFSYLNSRLARHYQLPGIFDDNMRRTQLAPTSRRGGVLTQGAILKVTANGTTTSPVLRGVWVSERLLGQPIPPPPAGVPAIEPDIRGAQSIREMLAKHRSDDACAACHVKIDPPGFALENFDPAGAWRDAYPRLAGGRRTQGTRIDASYTLADGRAFEDIDGFRQLVLADPSPLAWNVAEKLLAYGTGASVALVDRDVVESIVRTAADTDFGIRSLLHAVVASPPFLSK